MRVDDEASAVYFSTKTEDQYTVKSCSLVHAEWERDGNGSATSIVQQNGVVADGGRCGASQTSGTCTWSLQDQAASQQFPFSQILDEDSGETTKSFACTSAAALDFSATSGDFLEQQNMFYYAELMRTYMQQNCWDSHGFDQQANIDIHTDDPNHSTAAWNDVWTDIRIGPNFSNRPDALMHEYGHSVVWSYGDVSGWCFDGSDEGNAIDETLGDTFAMITIADDSRINTIYTTLEDNPFGGQFTGAHGHSASLFGLEPCASTDDHFVGRAFEQAFWELLFNLNCQQHSCANTTLFGHDIWLSPETFEDTIAHMGSALGGAMSALGQNITFGQIVTQMNAVWVLESGSATAARARLVFSHHGLGL